MVIEQNPFVLSLLILGGLVVLFLIVLISTLKRHFYHKKYILGRTKDWVFLEVQMPKENAGDEQKAKTSEEKKNLIAIAEQLYATLQGAGRSAGLYYPADYLSLEIACIEKKIAFYLNCPKHLQELVEKQIQAQYPTAYIEQIKGYNPFIKGGEVAASELVLSKKFVYPIKTYRNLETDPLNALTNAMSKLGEDEAAVIQVIISSAGNGWQGTPRHMALEIQQGKSPSFVEKGPWQRFVRGVGKGLVKGLTGRLSGGHEEESGHQRTDLSGSRQAINLTPQYQEIVKRLEEKASKAGYFVNVRIITSSKTVGMARPHLQNILSSFLQYNMPPFNGFKVKKRKFAEVCRDFIFRIYRNWGFQILNTEELASIWHLPTPDLETPNIKWLVSKKAPPPINMPTSGVLLGENIYRGVKTQVLLDRDDRRRHMYIIGRTGVGKTEIMKNMSVQDIKNGEGVCVIDPHGDFIEDILPLIPKSRAEDVILFEPFDLERPMGLNMLEVRSEEEKDFAIQEMISIFYKLVTDPAMLGPMFEHNMRNAMLTLMADEEHPGTLVEIPRIFSDQEFQRYKVSKLKDPIVRAFWEKEMAKTSDFHKSEMLGYLISKVGRFVENSMMRNIVGQPRSAFNFREVMDNKKILLVNLAKGKTGEMNAKLLGLILVSKLQIAALQRADQQESERKDFYLYVDEFQNFITDAFATILSEARKYRLNLIIAHQYLGQLEQAAGAQGSASKSLRDAVFGNVGTEICFRIGVEDAEVMAKEMAPTFNQFDLVNVDRFNGFIKLMINGTASKPFNMKTFALEKPDAEGRETAISIRQLSRLKFGRPRSQVESEILEASQVADMMSAGIGSIESSL